MRIAESVFTSDDLVRYLLRAHPHALPLLSTSASIRAAEPCAALWERWRREGCPAKPNPLEARCDFLRCGTFEVVQGGSVARIDAEAVAREVTRMVEAGATATIAFGDTVVTLTEHSAALAKGGWRRRGAPCRPTRAERADVVHALLTRTGDVTLPCAGTSAEGTVRVPAAVAVQVAIGDRAVMTATRIGVN